MKRYRKYFLFLGTSVVAVCIFYSLWISPTNSERLQRLLIAGATIVDTHTGEKNRMNIYIEGDQIKAIMSVGAVTFSQENIPNNIRIIDATGKYLIPGLWDMHVHLTHKPDIQDRISELFIANGVTSVRDMGGELAKVTDFRMQANRLDMTAPRIWIAGPLIDGEPPIFDGSPGIGGPAMSLAVGTPEAAISIVDKLVEHGVDLIKIYEMLKPEVFAAVIKRAHYHGIPVDGHIPARVLIQDAIAEGLDGIQHLSGMKIGCAHHAQKWKDQIDSYLDKLSGIAKGYELIGHVHKTIYPRTQADLDEVRCSALIDEFVKQGIWHTPTLSLMAIRPLRYFDRADWQRPYRYLPEPIRTEMREKLAVVMDAEQYPSLSERGEWAIKTVGELHKAGVKLLAGTDSVSGVSVAGFSLHDELEALVDAGLSPLAALQTATLHPAQFFSRADKFGVIEVDYYADLVLLDADPLVDIRHTRKINAVISKGRIYDRSVLDDLLSELVESE